MKTRISLLSAGLAVFLMTASPFSAMALPINTGIAGRTLIYMGPLDPPVTPSLYTTMPISSSFAVMNQYGRVVAQITSDANGDFLVSLRPGQYTIVPAGLPNTRFCSYATPAPFKVAVRSRHLTPAGFNYVAGCSPMGAPPAIY